MARFSSHLAPLATTVAGFLKAGTKPASTRPWDKQWNSPKTTTHDRFKGVLRGLHYQLAPEPQAKLVRSSVGSIFDVAIDIRQTSPTFGQWVGAVLSAENKAQLWVPEGFAHGFLTLSAVAEVQYKARGFWNKACERAIRWDDPSLAINWPQGDLNGNAISLSDKDA
jgi:dTDP-4-dehydrorhamnose 3,5-epimerase